MFNANDIFQFMDFINQNKIGYFIDGDRIDFRIDKTEYSKHASIPIESFNARPMWKNIERIRYYLEDHEEEED